MINIPCIQKSIILILFLFSCSFQCFAQDAEPPKNTTIEKESPAPDKSQQPPAPFSLEDLKNGAGTEDHFLRGFMNMLTSLGLIVVLIFLISWFLKKMMNTRIQQMNVSSDIKILERRALTPKTTIYILEVKGRGIIVAESINGLTRLEQFNVGNKEPSSFDTLLKEKMDQEKNP